MILHLDIETFSEAPLPKVGAWKYAQHPSTRVLMIGWAVDDEPPQVWEVHTRAMPDRLRRLLDNDTVTKVAHHAAFELAVLSSLGYIDFRPEVWRCTAVHALGLGLPGGLAAVASELKLAEQKADAGKTLIRRFSMPPPRKGPQPGPEDPKWPEFVSYCAQDVVTERAIQHRLDTIRPLPDAEWGLWHLDQRINQRGLPIDLTFVHQAMRVDDLNRQAATTRVQDITGVANPGSRNQLLEWLKTEDVAPDDLTASTVKGLLTDDDLPPRVREVLEHRQQLAASSTAKYEALARVTGTDGRIRGTLKFNGAHTGRWSGQLFQPQNLPRGSLSARDVAIARVLVRAGDQELLDLFYDRHSQVLASLVRSAVIAPPGQQLVVADLSAIESVVIAWEAGSEHLLNLFRDGRDPYKDFASKLYNIEYDAVTPSQRKHCKAAVLGCVYGLGGPGLQAYGAGFGLVLSEKEAKDQVDAFRSGYPEITKLWKSLEQAAFGAIETPGEPFEAGRCVYLSDRDYLWCQLPSGRHLAYRQPRVDTVDTSWGKREQLSYLGREGKNMRINTFAGRLAENNTQAIARDILAEGIRNAATDPDLEIVSHIHDEIVTLARHDDSGALERLVRHMTRQPEWATDLPLKAAGWMGPYYRKE